MYNSEITVQVPESPVSNSEPIPDPKPVLEKWNTMFVISCLFAVLLDPLFLYIPLINQEMKCIALDKNLKIAAVVLRSITDLVYIVKIIFQIYKLEKVTVMAIWRSYILIDILAILPIPQVVILIYFSKMRGSRSMNTRKFLNFLVLFQYVPRVRRIYLACKESKYSPKGNFGLWIKGGLNFFMYIFASHILGGFWYFFSVQRMIGCWQYACRNEDGCKFSTFNCHDHRTNRNIKLLSDSCPIDPSNAKIFDFGIFLDALQSDLVGSTDYSQKLSNCFWWSLRNLSSLGSNLQTSINTWENLFAAFTSITGLLLFLYLIGNVQMYMQLEASTRWKGEVKEMMTIERKTNIERKKGPVVERWLNKHHLPGLLKSKIMENLVKVVLDQNRDVDEDDIHSILPPRLQKDMERYKKIAEIEKWLSENALPMRFKSEIMLVSELEENRDVDVKNILSILPQKLQGDIRVYKENLEHASRKIELCLSENYIPMRFKSEIMEKVVQPKLEQNRDVDLKNILYNLPWKLQRDIWVYKKNLEHESPKIELWLSENYLPMRFKSEIIEKVVQAKVEQNRVVYEDNILTMLPSELSNDIKSFMQKMRVKDKEINMWLSNNGLPMNLKSDIMKTIQENFEENKDVDVENIISILPVPVQERIKVIKLDQKVYLWLIKNGIPTIEKSNIMEKVVELEKDGDVDLENFLSIYQRKIEQPISLNRLKKVKLLEKLDERVLEAICEHLKPVDYDSGTVIIRKGQPLEMILFVEGFVYINPKKNKGFHADGKIWGEELLVWPSSTSFPAVLPKATESLFSHYRTRALVLTASDMENIGSKFRPQFDLLTSHWLTMLKKVPKLERMDEEVLKAIFLHLKQNSSAVYHCIENRPFQSMNFITEGCIKFTRDTDCRFELIRSHGEVFGEELLDWVLDESFPALTPLSTHTAHTNEEAVVLSITAEELKSVATEFKSRFRKEPQRHLFTFVGMTLLKQVPKLKTMDEEVLKAISEHLKIQQYGKFVKIIDQGKRLDRMLFLLRGELHYYGPDFIMHNVGLFFGEELIDCLARSSDATRPLSKYTVTTPLNSEKVLVLILSANDLKSVVSKFMSRFS